MSITKENLAPLGSTSDTAVTSDTSGTHTGFLRGLVKILASVWDSTNNRLKVGVAKDVPTSANILVGCSSSNGGTIITIPANRVWAGWVSINASLAVAASGAAVSSRATVSVAGATATPAAGVLIGVFVSVPVQGTGTTAQVTSSDRTYVVIAAGASSATLTLQVNSASAASATASGELIA